MHFYLWIISADTIIKYKSESMREGTPGLPSVKLLSLHTDFGQALYCSLFKKQTNQFERSFLESWTKCLSVYASPDWDSKEQAGVKLPPHLQENTDVWTVYSNLCPEKAKLLWILNLQSHTSHNTGLLVGLRTRVSQLSGSKDRSGLLYLIILRSISPTRKARPH